MSLLPKFLKIIISAPQLPENKKKSFSPDPQNPWGPLSARDMAAFTIHIQMPL